MKNTGNSKSNTNVIELAVMATLFIVFSLMAPYLSGIIGPMLHSAGIATSDVSGEMIFMTFTQGLLAVLAFTYLKSYREHALGSFGKRPEVIRKSSMDSDIHNSSKGAHGIGGAGDAGAFKALEERATTLMAAFMAYTGALFAHSLGAIAGGTAGNAFAFDTTGVNMVLLVVYAVIITPAAEELLYRGVMTGGLETMGAPLFVSVICSSALWAVTHGEPGQMITAFLMGLVLAFIYLEVRSIKLTIALHALHNALVIFFPKAILPTAGLQGVDYLVVIVELAACVYFGFRIYKISDSV